MHYFEQLEAAAVELLIAPLKDLGVSTVEVYTGQLNDASKLKSIVNRLPAVWVISGDMHIETINQTKQLDLELVILTAAASPRGNVTAARGAKRPGAYAVLSKIRETLSDRHILTPFSPAEVFFEGKAFSAPEEGLIVYTTNFNLKAKLKGY